MATRKPGFKAKINKRRLWPSRSGIVIQPPYLPVPVLVVQFTGRRRPATLANSTGFIQPVRARGNGTRKPETLVKLVIRAKRYAPKGKGKQLGTWGTRTTKPPIRRIKVLQVRRPKRYTSISAAQLGKVVRVPAVVVARHVKATRTVLALRANRYRPAGSVQFLKPIRTFKASRVINPVRVLLVKRPKLRHTVVLLGKPVRIPVVAAPRHTKSILVKLVQRSRRYAFTGKIKHFGTWGTATTRRKPLLFKLIQADQRKQVRGEVKLGKVVRTFAPLAIPRLRKLVPVKLVKRPDRYRFKGKVKHIAGWGGVPPAAPRFPRPIMSVLVSPSRRYWKKVRKQVLSDHLATVTGRIQPKLGPTLLTVRHRRYTVNKGKVIRIRRFGSATRKPPLYKIKVVSLLKRRRKLPQTMVALGNVVRTFGFSQPGSVRTVVVRGNHPTGFDDYEESWFG